MNLFDEYNFNGIMVSLIISMFYICIKVNFDYYILDENKNKQSNKQKPMHHYSN